MADSGRIVKQEEDFTEAVDEILPKSLAVATGGNLHEAIEMLLPLEKKARMANDAASTSRLLVAVVSMCWEKKDLTALSEYIILFSKRRGQLKQAVTKMVQQACEYVNQLDNKEEKLKLIDTLRTVTAGKIHVEIERARLTKILSDIKEAEGNISEAADILQELQVETYGSMEKREKVEFILEQMRLGILRKDFIRTQIISKKISTRFFIDENAQDLKLKYYDLMKQLAEHDKKYLDICKYNREVYDTQQIKDDENLWKPVLRDVVYYLVLAPYDNEQSDLIARVSETKELAELPSARQLLQVFIDHEVMQWKDFEAQFGDELHTSSAFDITDEGQARWEDLRTRLVEHNIRVIADYYTCITRDRLRQILDLTEEQTEEHLASLVTNKTVFARIDRPAGTITFRESQDAADILNSWSSDISSLMRLVDRATHLIDKERMVHKV